MFDHTNTENTAFIYPLLPVYGDEAGKWHHALRAFGFAPRKRG